MKTYEGRREGYAVTVTVDGRRLNPRFDLYKQAFNLYQRFKWAVIVGLPGKRWTLTTPEIDQVLQSIREQEIAAGGVA